LLGRINESNAVEELGLNNGFSVILAIVELILAFILLLIGPGGVFHSLMFAGWLILTGFVVRRYFHYRRRWTNIRREMTHDLVEQMTGYRTRLVQMEPGHWHDDEESILKEYTSLSRITDRFQIMLTTVLPRGWLIPGLTGLLPPLFSGSAGIEQLAVGLGGILFAASILETRLGINLVSLIDAIVVWDQIALLFHAAARRETPDSETLFHHRKLNSEGVSIIRAEDISFRYTDKDKFVLQHINLNIRSSERLLLEGASGSGKSTLAALFSGLLKPESGALFADRIDLSVLDKKLKTQYIASAPQFQENYIFSETFAFNLLMERRWPPESGDLQEAEAVCREIGLDDLLLKMPSGMFQWIGEMGWQLSHGERSRLYIARALLQDSEMIMLDESFAALDPVNLQRALECVLRRAKTLLVIAHP
jgi:ATP-binding cassette subfamily B protein